MDPVLLLLFFATAASAEELATEHYSLRIEGADAAETGRVLEQLHRELTVFFGRSPEGRLRLELYATQEDWRNALARDGIEPMEAGGYYSPGRRTTYLFVQPSDYFTRYLTMHEAGHQFHYLAATGNRDPGPFWYKEGLVDYFAMHNWDGERLVTGAVPAVTLEDFPAAALKALRELDGGIEGLVSGKTRADRPAAWAFVKFLVETRPEKFRDLAARLDRAADPLESWRDVFGDDDAAIAEELVPWLQARQQPWKIVWIAWQERGMDIEGTSSVNALAVLKETPESLLVEMEPRGEKFKAGVVFGYSSPDDFHLLQVLSDGTGRVVHRLAGKWNILRTGAVPSGGNCHLLGVKINAGRVTTEVNGFSLGTYEAPGQVGVNVDACTALFRVSR